MELHTLDRQIAMTDPHDRSVLAVGGHHKLRGQRFFDDRQGVITGRSERVGQIAEDSEVAVRYLRGLAVYRPHRSALYAPSEGGRDALVSETHAQNRHAVGSE